MYKQQKPLTVASGLFALFVTALVLIFANAAHAQNTDPAASTATTNNTFMKREAVDGARQARPAETKATIEARPSNLSSQRSEAVSTTTKTQAEWQEKAAAKRAEAETKRTALESKAAERKTELEKKRQELASSTAARKAVLDQKAQERVKQAGERVKNILERAIGKIRSLSERLQNRANQLAGRGVDVSAVNSLLLEADTTLDAAEAALSGIETNLNYTVTSNTPKSDWSDARAQFKEVHELVRTAQGLLREAVATLKEAANLNTETGPAAEITTVSSSTASTTINQ